MGATTAMIGGALAGGQLLGGAVQGYYGNQAAQQQMAMAQRQLAEQRRLAEQNQQFAQQQGQVAADAVNQGTWNANVALQQGAGDQIGALQTGLGEQQRHLSGGFNNANALLGNLYGIGGQHLGDVTQSAYNADFGGRQDRLGSLLDQGLMSGFEQDPGYQFRQQQGEDAINRAAAARGGRLSGATLQELANFNQGLASQEFNNFANRRMQEAGLAGQSDARGLSALMNEQGMRQQAALAAQNNQMGLVNTGLGAMNQMASNQVAQGQLQGAAAAGMYGDIGNIYGNQASQLANLYAGQGSQLANIAQNTANQYAGIGSNFIPQLQFPTQYAGQGTAAIGNAINNTVGNLSALAAYGMMGG